MGRKSTPARYALLVLIAAAALRIYHLDYQSLWLDELVTWVRSSQPGPADVIAATLQSNWPPAYFVLMHGWMRLAGDSEFALRFPSALGGIVAVAAMIPLGTRLFNRRAGMLATWLTAVQYMPVYYSQEARAYTWLMALGILSIYLWLRMLSRWHRGGTARLPLLAGYAICASVQMYLHHFGLPMIALQVLVTMALLLVWRIRGERSSARRILEVIILYSLIGISYLPWLPHMLRAATEPIKWLEAIRIPVWLLSYRVVRGLIYPVEIAWIVLAAIVLSLVRHFLLRFRPEGRPVQGQGGEDTGRAGRNGSGLGGESSFWNRLERMWPTLLAAGLMIVPLAAGYVYSIAVTRVLVARYFIAFLPVGFYLVSGAALTPEWLRGRWQTLVVMLIAGGLVVHLVAGQAYYHTITKTDYREVAAFLLRQRASRDRSLWVGEHYTPYLDYYFRDAAWQPEFDEVTATRWTVPELEAAIQKHGPELLWYVWAGESPEQEVLAYLDATYPANYRREWRRAGVWVMEIPPP